MPVNIQYKRQKTPEVLNKTTFDSKQNMVPKFSVEYQQLFMQRISKCTSRLLFIGKTECASSKHLEFLLL